MVQKRKIKPLVGRWAVFQAWCSLWVLDFGFLRPFFNRPTTVLADVWRMNQPTPWRIRQLSRRGFKTILNLRGASNSAYHRLEARACETSGVQLINLKMSSRRPPTKETVEALYEVYCTSPRPLMLHCKSGADRAGLVSALFLLFSGESVEVAQRQLSLRFLHFKRAEAGMLDHFLACYAEFAQHTPVDFMVWVRDHYDRDAVKTSFVSSGLVSWLVDGVLRRE